MSVSVIIAAYNAAPFISRAIESALAQTLPPLEIIIADDCSTDATRAVLQAAAQKHPAIRLIHMPRNAGPSAARNAAIRAAKGQWLAVLDADDAFAPTRLGTLLAFASAAGADFVADDLALYDAAAGKVTGSGIGDDAVLPEGPVTLHDYLAHNVANGRGLDWGLLKPFLRRNALLERGIAYDETISHGEDFRLVVDLLLSGANFFLLREPLYLYTQRQGAISQCASGMTRTAIGYHKLKQAALALARDPRIAGAPGLVGLLHQRAAGLGRLDDAHFLSSALRRVAAGQIAARSARHPSFVPFMLVQIGRAMRRRLRATPLGK
jgi:succinoglycan biosynthesis protein ExoO